MKSTTAFAFIFISTSTVFARTPNLGGPLTDAQQSSSSILCRDGGGLFPRRFRVTQTGSGALKIDGKPSSLELRDGRLVSTDQNGTAWYIWQELLNRNTTILAAIPSERRGIPSEYACDGHL